MPRIRNKVRFIEYKSKYIIFIFLKIGSQTIIFILGLDNYETPYFSYPNYGALIVFSLEYTKNPLFFMIFYLMVFTVFNFNFWFESTTNLQIHFLIVNFKLKNYTRILYRFTLKKYTHCNNYSFKPDIKISAIPITRKIIFFSQ